MDFPSVGPTNPSHLVTFVVVTYVRDEDAPPPHARRRHGTNLRSTGAHGNNTMRRPPAARQVLLWGGILRRMGGRQVHHEHHHGAATTTTSSTCTTRIPGLDHARRGRGGCDKFARRCRHHHAGGLGGTRTRNRGMKKTRHVASASLSCASVDVIDSNARCFF